MSEVNQSGLICVFGTCRHGPSGDGYPMCHPECHYKGRTITNQEILRGIGAAPLMQGIARPTGEIDHLRTDLAASNARVEVARANHKEARQALRLIRETIETLGPVGCLPSEEIVACNPEHGHFLDEASVLVQGIQMIVLQNGISANTRITEREARETHHADQLWAECEGLHAHIASANVRVKELEALAQTRLRHLENAMGKVAEGNARIAELEAEVERGEASASMFNDALQVEVARTVQQRAMIEAMDEALSDLLGGWAYIRERYGDLYGVGWDRARKAGEGARAAKAAMEGGDG